MDAKNYRVTEAHINCIKEWIKDNEKESLAATHENDRAYYIGKESALKNVLELLAGEILDSDQNG